MTGYNILDNLYLALIGDSALMTMVGSKIYKNKSIAACAVDINGDVQKSQISCELSDIAGQVISADQIFVVDIRTRYETLGDGGQDYCAQIADAVRQLLDGGFTGAAVVKISGVVLWDATIKGYRCRLQVATHTKETFTLTLTPNKASPQASGGEIIVTAAASPNTGLEYRFLLSGPGSGYVLRDLSGWQNRNSFAWRVTDSDVGTSTIYVEIRGGPNKGAADQSTSISYTITAPAGTGTAPTITSLTPSLASPQEEEVKVDFICVAADVDSDQLYYRFFITGPGTADKKKLVQDWSHRNSWQWQPLAGDVGSSTIEVQIRDGLHAVEGSYDDTESVSYTITAAAGIGTAPTITSLTPNLASSQEAQTLISFICVAADVDSDRIYYRFFLTGPGTASKKKLVQDWGTKNYWEWNSREEDVGESTIEVQIRDGLHAGEGSYDDTESVSYTITAGEGGSGSAPTITSLTPSLASPRGQGTEIDFICVAADADSNAILYKFYLTGPGTASKKKLVQDWSKRNSWQWTPGAIDIGTSTIEVQVRDGNNEGEGSYDATTCINFVVSSNTAPTITSVYVNEPGDPYVGDKIHIVADAADTDGDKILYKFWIYRETVGASWEMLTGWQEENWLLYTVDKMDFETLSIKCQVRDGKHAGEESYDDEDTDLAITVQRAAITSVTPSLESPQANETTIVFSTVANKTNKIQYRFWQKGPGTGDVWRDMTGWQTRNSWSWRTVACDVGTNYVRAEVCDTPDTWDDADVTSRQEDLTYTIS